MKKLVLLGLLFTAISLSGNAQVSLNINIGAQPRYTPVRYVTNDYYYSSPVHYYAPARKTVYVRRVDAVRRPYYINTSYRRPVVYKKAHYKGHKNYYKKSHKSKGHGKGHR